MARITWAWSAVDRMKGLIAWMFGRRRKHESAAPAPLGCIDMAAACPVAEIVQPDPPAAPPEAPPASPAPCEPLPAAPDPKPRQRPPQRRQQPRTAAAGPSLKRDVLDHLDEYHRYITRMKQADPAAYAFYAKAGAPLMDMSESGPWPAEAARPLHPFFTQERPAFGAVAFTGIPPLEEMISMRFAYFTKYTTPPPGVQRAMPDAAFYRLAVYHDDTDRKLTRRWGHGASSEFYVAVTAAGEIRPLLQLVPEKQVIHHRHGEWRGRSTELVRQRWGIPERLMSWADDNELEPATFLRNAFSFVIGGWAHCHERTMVRIEARRKGVAAILGVDVLDIPTFFADRDITVTARGRKAPVFHIVRPHLRHRRDGTVIKMKAHFAGLREFIWNGHRVQITVPGREHGDLLMSGVLGAIDEEAAIAEGADTAKLVPSEMVGEIVADAAQRAASSRRRRR